MATDKVIVTETPQDIVAGLALSNGADYQVQNDGHLPILFSTEAVAPAIDGGWARLQEPGTITVGGPTGSALPRAAAPPPSS